MKSSPPATTTTQNVLDPSLAAARDDALAKARAAAGQSWSGWSGDAAVGPNAAITDAMGGYRTAGAGLGAGVAGLGGAIDRGGAGGNQLLDASGRALNLGFGAAGRGLDMAGSAAGAAPDIAGFMNPHTSNVIDANRAQFQKTLASTMNGLDASSTAAGAFGGDRAAIQKGQAAADLAGSFNAQTAGLLNSGYNTAVDNAMSDRAFRYGAGTGLANLGFGAVSGGMGGAGQLAGMGAGAAGTATQAGLAGYGGLFAGGDYTRGLDQQNLEQRMRNFYESRDWGKSNAGFLAGITGSVPNGGTQTQTQQMRRNAAGGFLGGAATGASIGSAIPGLGTAVGAGIGGILGLFS